MQAKAVYGSIVLYYNAFEVNGLNDAVFWDEGGGSTLDSGFNLYT